MPDGHDIAEPSRQRSPFRSLAAGKRDRRGILAQMNQRKAKIGLAALLLHEQAGQLTPEKMGQHRRDRDIDRSAPHHVTRDLDVDSEQTELQRKGRQLP